MSTKLILERLQQNWSEVPGITRAYVYEPEMAIDDADLPAVYPVVLGRQLAPAPTDDPGFYVISRQYVYRMLIATVGGATTESGDYGLYIDEQTVIQMDAPTDYFVDHPRLETDTPAQRALAGLSNILTIQDSGPIVRPGPGGAQYRCVDYTITLSERRYPSVRRLA